MRKLLLDFSPRGWGRVWLWTLLGTAFCVGVVLYVDSFNFSAMDDAERLRAILTDLLLPTVLAVPMLLFFTSKLRDLAIAHHQLTVIAHSDSLTGVLNRGAFSARVDAHLRTLRGSGLAGDGALLIVDADNFKAINDSFGHDVGDQALRLIVETMRAALRAEDVVGRVGGEEFGIFLPGLGPAQSTAVAERVRQAVSDAKFAPHGTQHALTISVGGALFHQGLSFSDLFRVADQQLYAAKQNGRNRVSVSPVESLLTPLAA